MSCTVFEILTLICQKIKTSRDPNHAHLGIVLLSLPLPFPVIARLILLAPTHAKIWRFYLQPFHRNLRECKILKWITWPGPRLSQGWLVVRRLTLDIACKHTKFDNLPEIFEGCEIVECVTWLWPHPLRGHLVTWKLVLLVAKPCIKFEVCSFSRPEDIS